MKKISLLIYVVLFLHLPYVEAKYDCTLNTAHSKGVLKDQILQFTFDPAKENSKSLQFKDYRFLVWKSAPYLMIKIKGGEFKKSFSIQFDEGQVDSRFHYGEDFDFLCQNSVPVSSSTGAHSLGDIATHRDKIKLNVNKTLVFSYHQSEEVELMRTIFFQDKKTYSESSKLVSKLPWCSLRVQLARNEDTTVEKGEVFNPVSYNNHNNNSYFTTYSYSFVDFASGKKYGTTRLYNPFMFNCNVLRGMTFNEDTLESIVGDYFKITL